MLHHRREFQLPLQIFCTHKYTKANSSQASLQYCYCNQVYKEISILSLFLLPLLPLPQQPTSWENPNSLFFNTYFADSWLQGLAHIRNVNITRQYSHCGLHSGCNAGKKKKKSSDIPEETELSLSQCNRRAERRTEGVKHSLCVSYVKSGERPINPDGDSRVNIYVHKPDWD